MAEATGKDVVAARINLDTSKVLQSFKVIDAGARGNAESFKALNEQLTKAEKSYKSMAAAMDKMALTSDQRRQKILAESSALQQQRNAQTALIEARTKQLDQANRLTDAKLEAQLAIVKRRQQQIEQQEREHQQRLQILQNRVIKSGQDATRVTGIRTSSSTDERTRERVLQEEQKIQRALEERQRAEEALREKVVQEEQRIRDSLSQTAQQTKQMGAIMDAVSKSWIGRLGDMAKHAVVFHTVYKAMHEASQAMKEGLVDIEANMAGYVQTNEHYFEKAEEGMDKTVIDTQKLHKETQAFIQTAHELGSNITDVTESARLWGRMYKDVAVVQELVRQSTKLSTVDLVELEDATKSMESVMSQYGVHIENVNDAMIIGNRVLDSWSKVAHDTMAPAQDLGAAFQRTGKIAAETGVSFDFMNGLISAGVRNTALSGENLGNMWKTVLGTIRTDKAVNEIERLGVKTKEVVNGVEQWRKAEDILLDLSIKVTDKNYDLTQSYADISRGVYQYAKLAASLNAGDILLGTAASIGSTGSTMDYLKVQMDTIQRKAAQTRTSLLEIFNTAGDDGLRQMIKDVLDGIDQLLIGLTKIPTGVYAAAAGLGGLLLAYKALRGPIMAVIAAVEVLNAAKAKEAAASAASTAATTADTVAKEAQTVATAEAAVATSTLSRAQATATVTMAAATAGLSLLVGAIAIYAFQSGKAEKAERDRVQQMKDQDSASQQMISQYQRQIELLPKLVEGHNSLKKMIDGGTLSSSKKIQTERQLDQINQALIITLGKRGAAELEAAGYTESATQQQIASLNQLIVKEMDLRKATLGDQKDSLSQQLEENIKDIDKTKGKVDKLRDSISAGTWNGVKPEAKRSLEQLESQLESLEVKNRELKASIADTDVQMGKLSMESVNAQNEMDALSGSAGKTSQTIEQMTEELKKQTETLKQAVRDSVSSIAELNQTAMKLAKGESLSAQSVADLILKYPQLAAQIRKTTDGWTLEGQVLEKLRQAKIKKAIDDLKAERDSTRTVALESLRRMQFYGQEFESITTFAEARKKISELQAGIEAQEKASTNHLNSRFIPQKLANFLEEASNRLLEQKREQLKQAKDIIQQYAGQLQLTNEQIEAMNKLLNDNTFGLEENDDATKGANKTKRETVEIMTQLQKAIEGYNKSLEKLDSQQKRVAKSSQEYLDILEQKRKALLEEQKLYEQGYNDPSQLVSSQMEVTTGGAPSIGITKMLNTAVDLANWGGLKYKQIPDEFTGSFEDFKQRAYSDCSQFVQEMFKTIGVQLPRTAAAQAKVGTAVSQNNLQAGDLVFFNTVKGKENSHVGIYMRDGKFIQMGESGLKVSDMNSSYWADKYNGATRVPGLQPGSAYPTQNTDSGVAYAGKYAAEINAAAKKYGVDPYLIAAVISQESSFGAKGITNVMQVKGMDKATVQQSIDTGTKMLSGLLKESGGDVAMALGGYNMGKGIIDWFKKSGGYNRADMVAYSNKYKKSPTAIYGDVDYVEKILPNYASQKRSTPTQKELLDAKKTSESELRRISDELYNIDVEKLESKLGIKEMKISDRELLLKQSEARQKNMKKDSQEYKAEYEQQLKLKTEIQTLMQEQRQMIENSGLKSDELINKRRSLTEKIGDIQSEKDDMKDRFASEQFETAQANMESRVERMRQQGRSEIEMTKTQLLFYQEQLKNTALTEEQRAESAKQVYDLTQKMTELQYQNSTNWIDKQTEKMERQGKTQVDILQMQAEAYNRMRNSATLTAAQRAEAEKSYQDTVKKLTAAQYEQSEKWIAKEAIRMEMAGKTKVEILQMELETYLRMQADKTKSVEQQWELEQNIYKTRAELDKEYYSAVEKRINHSKAIGQMTTAQELAEYQKLQAAYLEGSEQRMDADEKVYALKQKLLEETTKAVSQAATQQKKKLDTARDEEIKRIQAEKDAFTAAQDAKIKAIDDQLAAMDRVYDQEDYERQRAKKVDRLKKLESAVGPDGIAERKRVQEELEDLDREHNRKLAKQELEDKKTALQEEKATQEKDFDDKLKAARDHYEELSKAFDDFSSTTEFTAENLKNIQILKESEKNETILAMLDQFVADYNSRLKQIAGPNASILDTNVSGTPLAPGTASKQETDSKARDLYIYNSNKDAWEAAKKRGDTEAMRILQEQNEAIRKKYGIVRDTGKLQHFSKGGVVQGPRGAAVPVIAHAGEAIFNDDQQRNLFKLLNLRLPRLDFSMPQFSTPATTNNKTTIDNRVTITRGDTYIEDGSAALAYWNEEDNFLRRLNSRGVKP